MSKLLSFGVGAGQAFGPLFGIRIGSLILTPAAAASTAVITDGAGTTLSLAAPASGGSATHQFCDPDGIALVGQCTVTVTGTAAVFIVEQL